MHIIDILKKHNIQVEQVEESVFKVINSEQRVNIDNLKRDLKEFIAIISSSTEYKKDTDSDIYSMITSIYYLITDYNNKKMLIKYFGMAKQEHKNASIESYRERPELAVDIPSLWEITEGEK